MCSNYFVQETCPSIIKFGTDGRFEDLPQVGPQTESVTSETESRRVRERIGPETNFP